METFLTTLTTGILIGGVYALVAFSWVVIYKCSGVLNLATGEMVLLGAFVGLTANGVTGNFFVAILAVIAAGVIAGLVTERLVIRPLIGEPLFAVVMITLGLSFALRGIIFAIWGTPTRVFDPAPFPMKPMMLGFVPVSPVYLGSFGVAIAMVVALTLFFNKTMMGLAMQATADDETAALSMGIPAKAVYRFTWILGFIAAGIGGALLGNINGVNSVIIVMGLLVLPAVVLGGFTSIPGAIVGGIALGVLQTLSSAYIDPLTGGAWWFTGGGTRDVIPFVVMVIILLVKPYGLWGWVKIERM